MTGHVIDKIGYHGLLTWHLELDGVRVPEGDRSQGPTAIPGREQVGARSASAYWNGFDHCRQALTEKEILGPLTCPRTFPLDPILPMR